MMIQSDKYRKIDRIGNNKIGVIYVYLGREKDEKDSREIARYNRFSME